MAARKDVTLEQLRKGRPAVEADPDLVASMLAWRGRGRPKTANPKQRITLYVDADALAAFKATGPGWQTRMSDALKEKAPR